MKKWILIPCGIGALVAGAATALLVSLRNSLIEERCKIHRSK